MSLARFVNRRNSDQFLSISGLTSGDNKDQFTVKDDDVMNMSLSSGGSIRGNMSQSNLHRTQPFQDITTLGVTDPLYQRTLNEHPQTGSKSQSVYNDYNMNLNRMNVSSGSQGIDRAFDSNHLLHGGFTSPDRKTTLNIDNTRLRQALDEQNRMTCGDSSSTDYELSSLIANSASPSGRRSAIPVLVRRRSVSACGEPSYGESSSLQQPEMRVGPTTPVTDFVISYRPVQTSKPVLTAPHSHYNYTEQFAPICPPSQQVLGLQNKPGGQRSFQSRPQSANANVGYTHRSNLPAVGRVLPVAPSAATSTTVRNGRALPLTPGSSAIQTRTVGRSLPAVPNTAVQKQRSSGRTLPTLPPNTAGRLPASAAIDRNRSQLPKKSSQSQPGSRSTSPSSRLGYITYTQPPVEANADQPATSGISRPRSCIPRSRGQSRDTSPTRRGPGNVDGPQVLNMLEMQKGREMENAVNTALLQHNLVSRLQMDGSRREDAMSETSSLSSDSCGRNTQGAVMDVSVIVELVSSGVWSERRDGLVALQTFLKSDAQLSATELKKMTELFTRMFHDPNPKVFVVFLETLPNFVSSYAADVPSDWMYTCLSRLLEKTSADLLKSVSERVQAALKSVRDTFVVEDQWASMSRFVCESTKISDPKVRLSFVEYLNDMVVSMDSSELSNSTNVQQVILRVIAWMSDRKFQSISRVAQHVIIALFNVNTPEFSTVLSSLPRSMRDTAFKLLQNHMSSVSYDTSGDSGESVSAVSPIDYKTHLGSGRSSEKCEDDFSAEDFNASFKKMAEDIQNLSLQD